MGHSGFRSRCRSLLASLLLLSGMTYAALLMSAEVYYAHGWQAKSLDDLMTARRLYPGLIYVRNGPELFVLRNGASE